MDSRALNDILLSVYRRIMLDISMGAKLVEHPPGADPDVDRRVCGDQQPRRLHQSHQESSQVPSRQSERHQRLHRRHWRPQLRAGSLRLPGPRDLL